VHVCHVFPYAWYISGGPSNGLREHIASQIAAGISAEALSPGPDPAEIGLDPRVTLPCDVSYVDFDSRELPRIVAAIRKRHGNNVLFNVNSVSRPAIKISRELREQGIQYVHTSVGDLHWRSFPNFVKKFLFVNFLSRSVRGASGVHVLTQQEANRLKYLLPFWTGSTTVAPYVVRASAVGGSLRLRRSDVGLPEDGFLFMYLGRMDMRQKGLDILVRAFSMLPPERCRLALVGPNRVGARQGSRDDLEKLARSLDCEDRVHFISPQEGEKKWRALKVADAFVHPSRWDGFAISVAEALACGIPTVISNRMNIAADLGVHDAVSIAELRPGSLSEKMAELMERPEERERLSRNGIAWVSKFCSRETVGARFAEFYSMLLGKTDAPS
jgi:glycosyltransferase involved in cell wall biosynthesis